MTKSLNKDEMQKVMLAIMDALPSGRDYIADNEDQYFNAALHIFEYFNEQYNLTLKRVPPGVEEITPDGRAYMIDTYKSSSGKIFRMGYWK